MGANVFDIIIVVLLGWSAYRGFTKGLISSVISLIALLVGIWGAIKFSNVTSVFLANHINVDEKVMGIIAFALTFILIVVLIHFLAKAVEKLVEAVALGFVNKIFGALFGILKIGLIVSVFLAVINTVNSKINLFADSFKENSIFYKPLAGLAPKVFNYLNFEDIKDIKERVDSKTDEVVV